MRSGNEITDFPPAYKLITFKTPDSPTAVLAFYRDSMSKQGWKPGDDPQSGDENTLSYYYAERTFPISFISYTVLITTTSQSDGYNYVELRTFKLPK